MFSFTCPFFLFLSQLSRNISAFFKFYVTIFVLFLIKFFAGNWRIKKFIQLRMPEVWMVFLHCAYCLSRSTSLRARHLLYIHQPIGSREFEQVASNTRKVSLVTIITKSTGTSSIVSLLCEPWQMQVINNPTNLRALLWDLSWETKWLGFAFCGLMNSLLSTNFSILITVTHLFVTW